MAKPKIAFEALDDQNGVSRYLISKRRGKLTLDEVQDTCREHLGVGFYCVWKWRIREEGGNGNWYEEDEGDCVIIETAEPTCNCPVCLQRLDDNF